MKTENKNDSKKENKKESQLKILKKVLPYIKPYKGYCILTIFLALISVISALYLPILTGNAVDLVKKLADKGEEIAGVWVEYTSLMFWEDFSIILITMGIVILFGALAQWSMTLCNNKIVFSVTQDVRKKAFRQIQKLPLGYLDRNSSGDLVSRMIADVDQFADGLLLGFTQLFTGIITILGTLVFMFIENATIALVVFVVTPLSLFVASFIAKKTYGMFKLQTQTRGEQTALINEMLSNQKVVQSFNREDAVIEQFDEVNERLKECSLKATFFSSLVNPSTRVVNNIVYAGVALTGGLSVISGGLTIGQLTIFLSYANQYTKPFNEISGVITELQNALACADRVFGIIEESPEVPDAADAAELKEAKGVVDLKDVSFSYVPEKKLIENLNLHVDPGRRIAIVGPTGCGKTTLINLIMRFYDVNSGEISVDGTPIKKLTRRSLRKNYGMVLQDTWLKKGTIRDNIIVGKPDATDEEMIEAAKKSHAHSFIRRLPQGYDTEIAEDGGSLSGGQKQLLCITRVMLSLPPMLILDEATSSIDTRTELKIRKAFDTMMEGRTSFVVAHRLSTIKNADVILVMKDGHVIEQGNHDTLLKQGGFYSNLYNSQFSA
ncbi:MAG: ABC transporter ATP-binding protein/permease [Lachnospiraceae bacterium]|nr:ABC transporter ATP-binding protein/permease [Lachnospiraceae bacterium]